MSGTKAKAGAGAGGVDQFNDQGATCTNAQEKKEQAVNVVCRVGAFALNHGTLLK